MPGALASLVPGPVLAALAPVLVASLAVSGIPMLSVTSATPE
ncbi:hypothetical protein [Nannocystis pusilla]